MSERKLIGTLDYMNPNNKKNYRLKAFKDGKEFLIMRYNSPNTHFAISKTGKTLQIVDTNRFESEKEIFTYLVGVAGTSMKDCGFANFTWKGKEYTEYDLPELYKKIGVSW